jgi:glycosyltransferase involved in cell wall biosynthesis
VPDSLPDAASLNVLMISLGDEVLTGWGDTRERHLDYAGRINHLHMVGYSPRTRNLQTTALSEHLTFYPTRSATRPGFVLDAYRIGTDICRQHPIDVITTQDPFTTGLAGVLLKHRFHVTLDLQNHSDFFDNRYWLAEKPQYRVLHTLGKWVVHRGDTHRVLNHEEQAKYVRMGIPADRIVTLSTPVRLGRFTPAVPLGESEQIYNALGIPIGASVLLWVGNPVWFKRVPVLIDAFAQVHQQHASAHLVLVGNLANRPEIAAQVHRLGLESVVHFPGKADHDALPAYYRMCDVYIHSSIYEGFGKVMVEAAACGKPVVATHTAGAQEIICDGETGLVCEAENPADMAAKIIRLLDDPAFAVRLGTAARAHVLDKFDHTRNLDAVIDTWRHAASLRGES